jgi:hypothetical protein
MQSDFPVLPGSISRVIPKETVVPQIPIPSFKMTLPGPLTMPKTKVAPPKVITEKAVTRKGGKPATLEFSSTEKELDMSDFRQIHHKVKNAPSVESTPMHFDQWCIMNNDFLWSSYTSSGSNDVMEFEQFCEISFNNSKEDDSSGVNLKDMKDNHYNQEQDCYDGDYEGGYDGEYEGGYDEDNYYKGNYDEDNYDEDRDDDYP